MPMRNPLAGLVRRNPEAPTLRQRAASLKAAAARVIRKPVAAPAPAPVEVAETAPDPIFAAMAKSRALQAAKDALYCGHLPDKAPEWVPFHEAYDEWAEHLDGVLKRTVPTTAAGCIALAQFTVDFCAAEGIPLSQKDGEQDNIEPLRLIAQSSAPSGVSDPFDWNAFAAMFPGFMPVPAHDPAGLVTLSLAIPSEARRMLDLARAEIARREGCYVGHPDPSIWPRLAAELRREMRMDLLELVAADLPADQGSPMSFGAARGGSVSAPAIPDLSEITVMGLCNLFDRFAQSADYWNDTMHAGWARDKQAARSGFLEVNAAGELAEVEHDRAASFRDAIAAEIARRPLTGDTLDDDARLGTLIRFELMCNMDLRHAPVLRDAIAERWSA